MEPPASGSSPWPISADVIDAALEAARYACSEACELRLIAADARRRAAWERQRAGVERARQIVAERADEIVSPASTAAC
jgi:hypothetical protein